MAELGVKVQENRVTNSTLTKEVDVDRRKCCARTWSENLVCKAVVAQGEYGFGFALLGCLVKSQLQRLSQKALNSIPILSMKQK